MPKPWERQWDDTQKPWERKWEDPSPERPTPGIGESIGRGMGQGLSLGFQDELAGLLSSPVGAYRQTKRLFGGDVDPNDESLKAYLSARDEQRQANEAAKRANPAFYYGGEGVGTIATSLLPGVGITRGVSHLGKIAKTAGLIDSAALGAALGAGQSEAQTGREMGQNMIRGAAGGLLGAGVAKGVQKVGNALANPVVEAMTDVASWGSPSRRLLLKGAKAIDTVNRKVGEGMNILPATGGLMGSKLEGRKKPLEIDVFRDGRLPQSDEEIEQNLEKLFPREPQSVEEQDPSDYGSPHDDAELEDQAQGLYNLANDPSTPPDLKKAYLERVAEIDDMEGDGDAVPDAHSPRFDMWDEDKPQRGEYEEGDTSEYEAWKRNALRNPPQLVLPKYEKKKGLIRGPKSEDAGDDDDGDNGYAGENSYHPVTREKFVPKSKDRASQIREYKEWQKKAREDLKKSREGKK